MEAKITQIDTESQSKIKEYVLGGGLNIDRYKYLLDKSIKESSYLFFKLKPNQLNIPGRKD